MVDVFISYSRQDSDFVEKLHEMLLQLSVAVWIDLKDIPPTAEFMQEIYLGIESANNFLFIISPTGSLLTRETLPLCSCAEDLLFLDSSCLNHQRSVALA